MTASTVEVLRRDTTSTPPDHHVGNPPTSFRNPWPSASRPGPGLTDFLATRFGFGQDKRNFVPVPSTRDELVDIRKPDWGVDKPDKLRATWFGHASFLVETPVLPDAQRGVRVLLDPVFANQMGPWAKLGPKRFSPLPCSLEQVPEVDAVMISHSHYDHLDIEAIKQIHAIRGDQVHFFCGLNLKSWFISCGIPSQNVTELDWWEEALLTIEEVGTVKLVCTPAQHTSGRTPTDRNHSLWVSWIVEANLPSSATKKLYFAGDTGYRMMSKDDVEADDMDLPHCPAFAEIGEKYGPFDLALLPIGCFLPKPIMSMVHCAPEDSVCIHQDLKTKKSIGMHYGTIRGQLSGQYEEVTLPPRRFKEKAIEAGLAWGQEIGLCDIGETVAV